MKRLFGLPGIPALEQISYAIITQLERLLALGGAVPLAMGLLVAYLLLVSRRRATAS